MRSLFDVNVLLALFQPSHAHYERAQAWWRQNRNEGWSSCPLTQNGFVRIVSQPKYEKALSVLSAIEVLAEQMAATDHASWPDDISIIDPTSFDHARILGPNQLTDVYLLALAVKNAGRLVTLDSAISISAVRGARPEHLVVI